MTVYLKLLKFAMYPKISCINFALAIALIFAIKLFSLRCSSGGLRLRRALRLKVFCIRQSSGPVWMFSKNKRLNRLFEKRLLFLRGAP